MHVGEAEAGSRIVRSWEGVEARLREPIELHARRQDFPHVVCLRPDEPPNKTAVSRQQYPLVSRFAVKHTHSATAW
jgi:hypothetical protein